ncbi:hypothetical protein LF1_34230 [Rubripirellula obstinata]|uniref:Uncharacterized protein n=1 Tax=Rubripirellula obstinata TaxID=406547 RepID=A0A5B1CKP5_9BACT|nr:hypothetical protein LF1_34230 [Rubripirellula obstinata]
MPTRLNGLETLHGVPGWGGSTLPWVLTHGINRSKNRSPGWGGSTLPWVLTHGIKRSKNRSPGWGGSTLPWVLTHGINRSKNRSPGRGGARCRVRAGLSIKVSFGKCGRPRPLTRPRLTLIDKLASTPMAAKRREGLLRNCPETSSVFGEIFRSWARQGSVGYS